VLFKGFCGDAKENDEKEKVVKEKGAGALTVIDYRGC
jgi:hypothetical protein